MRVSTDVKKGDVMPFCLSSHVLFVVYLVPYLWHYFCDFGQKFHCLKWYSNIVLKCFPKNKKATLSLMEKIHVLDQFQCGTNHRTDGHDIITK